LIGETSQANGDHVACLDVDVDAAAGLPESATFMKVDVGSADECAVRRFSQVFLRL
jgi:hypothetical protein